MCRQHRTADAHCKGRTPLTDLEADVTERKKAETAPKENLQDLRRLARVVSDSNDAVILYDFEGKILAWNRGAKETYGYTEAEALGKNVRDIVAEPDCEAALSLNERIKGGEAVKSFELRRVTKDSRILDVWLTTTLLTDETGKPVAIATTERDITERKEAERKRKGSGKEAGSPAGTTPAVREDGSHRPVGKRHRP
jgi:PAS domain S-box-containing protein